MSAQSTASSRAPAGVADTNAVGAYDDVHTERNYPPGVEYHWWTRARNTIIARHLRRVLRPGEKAIEIGCGTGVVVDALRRRGFDVVGVDLAAGVPATPAVGPHVRLGVDACSLPAEERASYKVLMLFDVLEHMPEPAAFLTTLRDHFPNATHALVTLPARQDAWTNYDEFFGHYRRYDRGSLATLETPGRVTIERSAYFFHALWPVLRVLKALGSQRETRMVAPGTRSRPLHAIVAAFFAAEAWIIPGPVWGLSLVAEVRLSPDDGI